MALLLSHGLEVPGARCLAAGELRGHMEERFGWALRQGHAVGALACDLLGLEDVERRHPGCSPRVLGTLALALEPAFRVTEAIVQRDEGRLVVLLVGPDPMRMEAACREWVSGAKELRLDGVAGGLGMSLRVGFAVTQPGKRLFLDTLIQVAGEGLRVARCRGPGACVHTMLYDILQGRLEWERGTEGLAVTASTALTSAAPGGAAARDGERVAARPGALEPSPPRDPRMPARASASTASEPRERELLQALDAERRENDRLRARLQALEARDPPSDEAAEAARGTQETLATPDGSAEDRIQQLERRLAKLRLALAETEERLAQAAGANAVDSGIASCHRTVQGLDADAPHHALKTALLEKIFAANLELRECLRQGRRQAS